MNGTTMLIGATAWITMKNARFKRGFKDNLKGAIKMVPPPNALNDTDPSSDADPQKLNVKDFMPKGWDRDESELASHRATTISGEHEVAPYRVSSVRKEKDEIGLTELGNGKRFARHHARRIRYVPGWGWLTYSAGKWTRQSGSTIEAFAKATASGMLSAYAEAIKKPTLEDEQAWHLFGKHAQKTCSAAQIRSMMRLAKSEPGIAMRPDEWNDEPSKLNVMNGLLDLETGELEHHAPEQYCTHRLSIAYDAEAQAPMWRKFLAEITEGDQELERFLQKAAGYTLTGYTREHCLFFLLGDGANGKSTLLEVLRHVLGEYADAVPTGFLMNDRRTDKENVLARLQGTRMVLLSEAGEERRFDEAFLKQVTGEDVVAARRLFHEGFAFQPSFKMWIHGNSRPRIDGADAGIWRRFHLIPFNRSFSKEQQDRQLVQKLKAESEGILAWMVEGATAWHTEGLSPPPCMTDALAEYRGDMDIVGHFIEERCLLGADYSSGASDLLRAFNDWALSSGYGRFTSQKLGSRLGRYSKAALQRAKDGRGCVVWRGLSVRPS